MLLDGVIHIAHSWRQVADYPLGVPAVIARRRAHWPLLIALTAPCVAAFTSALRRPWLPVSDWALIELRVRAVGTRRTPLVGAYSRFGWDHPGPWPFYLLAAPYRVVGAAHGLLGGAALWNLVALGALAVLVIRRDLLLAVVSLPLFALLVHGLGAGFLSDPWNPSLPVLPLAALVPLTFVHLEGRRWTPPVVAGLTSVIVQAHVGFLPVVGALLATATVGRWWRMRTTGVGFLRRSTGGSPAPGRRGTIVAATVAVVLVAWAPPLLDQAVHRPGNIDKSVRSALDPSTDLPAAERGAVGPARALRLLERQFGVPAPWLGARERLQYFDVDSVAGTGRPVDLLPVLGVAAVATAVALRRRDRDALALLGLCVTGMAGCFVGLAAVRGAPYQWIVRWCWPMAAWMWAAALWALARAIRAAVASRTDGWTQRARPWVLGGATLVTTGLTITTISSPSLGHRPHPELSAAMGRLAPTVEEVTRRSRGVFLFPSLTAAPETFGLAVALERAGRRWTLDLGKATAGRYDTTLAIGLLMPGQPVPKVDGRHVLAITPTYLTGPLSPTMITLERSPFDGATLRALLGDFHPPAF